MDDLALQVRLVHHVEVHDAQGSDPRRREIHGERRAQTPGPDGEYPGLLQLLLSVEGDLRHDQVPAVACDLLVGQIYRPVGRLY